MIHANQIRLEKLANGNVLVKNENNEVMNSLKPSLNVLLHPTIGDGIILSPDSDARDIPIGFFFNFEKLDRAGSTPAIVSNDISGTIRELSNNFFFEEELTAQADWNETETTANGYIQNKPSQVNFSIYNQNKSDKVTITDTTKTSVVVATTGNKIIPSHNAGDSFIGKLYGTFNPKSSNRKITIFFKLGNQELSAEVFAESSGLDLAFSIDYVINFPLSQEPNISGVIRCADKSAVLDMDFTPIAGNLFDINVKLDGGIFVNNASLLHRNYN